ncbi:Plant transposase [Cucumis melo var. makuwa]|uniref:Plant transposase n=2 Tax=Cucumis melo var. makuwa TaxID=1194695 RepID=A0A5A7UVE9_CUCMM|nr:Plant transposase [Cucumis melo var. makuwa]
MGRLWRAGKSRMVKQIQSTSNNEELSKMKPSNIQSTKDWMDFVKEKKSAWFKAESAKFKSMKKRQLPHTCSHKDSSSVTRIALWTKAHRKKDGTSVNSEVAETLERINEIENEGINILGPDRGHIRAFGFGVTTSNFSLLSKKDDHYAKLEEKCEKMEVEMTQMRSLISHLLKSQGNGSDQLSNATNDQVVNNVATNPIGTSPPNINNNNTLRKCTLLDWGGTEEVVSEGRWSSNDLNVTVHHVPLGPHAVRVWVDLPKKSDAFLWRPNSEMTYIDDAVGSTVAWPLDKVILS